MLHQMVFAVPVYMNDVYSGSIWGEGEGEGCVTVPCELGVECVLTGLCCVLDDVLGYKEELLTVETLF